MIPVTGLKRFATTLNHGFTAKRPKHFYVALRFASSLFQVSGKTL